jgi:hypothetical protein
MKRTQIQLPDNLYHRLKRMPRSQETTLSDILRRAGEYILSVHPEHGDGTAEWQLPPPVDLGHFRSEEADWRALTNEPGEERDHAQR